MFATDAAEAVVYLHSLEVVHRDIKPQNFLVTYSAHLGRDQVKISDFGESRCVGPLGHLEAEHVGTPNWMSPEAFEHRAQTKASDVYSIALLVHECLTQKVPFEECPEELLSEIVLKGVRPPISAETITEPVAQRLQQAWNAVPDLRPCAEDILNVLNRCIASSSLDSSFCLSFDSQSGRSSPAPVQGSIRNSSSFRTIQSLQSSPARGVRIPASPRPEVVSHKATPSHSFDSQHSFSAHRVAGDARAARQFL